MEYIFVNVWGTNAYNKGSIPSRVNKYSPWICSLSAKAKTVTIVFPRIKSRSNTNINVTKINVSGIDTAVYIKYKIYTWCSGITFPITQSQAVCNTKFAVSRKCHSTLSYSVGSITPPEASVCGVCHLECHSIIIIDCAKGYIVLHTNSIVASGPNTIFVSGTSSS